MTLTFEAIREDDIPDLTEVMTRAFDHDTLTNLGEEKGGPPGYDDGEFFRKWLFSYDESRGYKIILEGRVVGGFIVWVLPSGNNILGTIFIDPEYQRRGIATRAWRFIEETYPETRRWRLETPSYSVGNQHFYERKCGFRKVGESETDEHPGKSFTYEKIMKKG
jgi:ribosomal protein S18 acetylase RimI-like enzyme